MNHPAGVPFDLASAGRHIFGPDPEHQLRASRERDAAAQSPRRKSSPKKLASRLRGTEDAEFLRKWWMETASFEAARTMYLAWTTLAFDLGPAAAAPDAHAQMAQVQTAGAAMKLALLRWAARQPS